MPVTEDAFSRRFQICAATAGKSLSARDVSLAPLWQQAREEDQAGGMLARESTALHRGM